MNTENLRVAVDFIEKWRTAPTQRVWEEIVSFSNETKREPDRYHFDIEDGHLKDPVTKKAIADFVEKDSYLGKAEYEVLLKLENWAKNNSEGAVAWVSPPYPEKYPAWKIILSKIAYTENLRKVILNTAVLFDAPFLNTQAGEKIRGRLFLLGKSVSKTTDFCLPFIGTDIQRITQMIQSGRNPWEVAIEMQRSGLVGQFSVSCANLTNLNNTFSDTILGFSRIINFSESGKFVKNCGRCGIRIEAKISKGYRCGNCGGVYKGC